MGGMSSTEVVVAMRFEKMLAGVLFTGVSVNGLNPDSPLIQIHSV
jgi:hypothetical protein